jgi:hypothetical protein
MKIRAIDFVVVTRIEIVAKLHALAGGAALVREELAGTSLGGKSAVYG